MTVPIPGDRASTHAVNRCALRMCVAVLIWLAVWPRSAEAARVERVRIRSEVMQLTFPAVIVLPDEAGIAEPVPAVYLLHGFGSGPEAMAETFDLATLADRYGLAIVCPSGSPASWYLDSPVDSGKRFETYIVREVVPWVEERYPVVRGRTGRAITGVSMGGHGALYLAIRHPDMFAAAGSISGVLDLRLTTQPAALARVLGSLEDHRARWMDHSVTSYADSVPPGRFALVMDSGTEDPFIEPNRAIHARLIARGVHHVYTERPGGHSMQVWRPALEHHLLFFRDVLR